MDFTRETRFVREELDSCAQCLDGLSAARGRARARKAEETAEALLRSADARLAALCLAGAEADCGDGLGAQLARAAALASQLGDVELVRQNLERLLALPSAGRNALRKLEAGATYVSDCSLCRDFPAALACLMDLRKLASSRTGAQVWLSSASDLASALAGEGRSGEALEVYAAMRAFRRWDFSRAARAGAAAGIVACLRREGDLERAFAVFREAGAYAGGGEAFRLYMRAGLTLLPPLSRCPERGRYAFLARAFRDPGEPPERSLLRGEAALACAADLVDAGELDEARAVLEAFAEFSGDGLIAESRARAVAAVAEGYLDAGRPNDARALIEAAAEDAGARDRAGAGPRAGYAALFGAALRLVGELDDCGREAEARAFCRRMECAAADDRDSLAFAEAALDAVTARCRCGFVMEALGLYRAFSGSRGGEPVQYARCRMGAAAVRALCGMGFAEDAQDVAAGLPAPRRQGDRVYYERLQAETAVFNSLLNAGLLSRAHRLYRRRADYRGPEKAALRWLKAAGKLVESYVAAGDTARARAVFEHARREAPKGVRVALRILAMAQDLITGLCERGDLAAARALYEALPDPGPSARFEEEKAEIGFFLTLNYCRRGEIRDALGFFGTLPEESPTGRLPLLKARTAAWLIAELSGRGRSEEAFSVYECLARLGEGEALELVRAKSAIRLVSAFTQSGDTDRALELLLTVPAFCDPRRVARQLRDAVLTLSLSLAGKNETEKAGDLSSFAMEFL
ncbi:MAG: hypothetical protein LBG06_09575 [Deltaproteobacteria bacterium]|jgi:tetratricopeptide (TPR) repeat protein|nr:hypothetical protein [Deltaproteobacteria bacterium]